MYIFCPIFSYVTNNSLLQTLFAMLTAKSHSFCSVHETRFSEFARLDILPVMDKISLPRMKKLQKIAW